MNLVAGLLANAAIYSLSGLCLLGMRSVSRVTNLALGEVVLLAAMTAAGMTAGGSLGVAVSAALATAALVSWGIDRVFIFSSRVSVGDGASDATAELALGFGMALMLSHALALGFGGYPISSARVVAPLVEQACRTDGSTCRAALPLLLATLPIGIAGLLLRFRRGGVLLRAIEGNPMLCAVYGVRIPRIRSVVVLACGVGLAYSGLLLFERLEAVSPFVGAAVFFRALAVAVIAGRLQLTRVVLAAVAVATAETVAGSVGGDVLQQLSTYVVLGIAVFVLRPGSRTVRPA